MNTIFRSVLRAGAACLLMAALASGQGAPPQPDLKVPAGPFQAAWESLVKYSVPDWYLDGKFGIFIHWGVYSVPAFGSEWYPRNMYQAKDPAFKHHVETYGPQSKFGYKDFIPLFKAERFDPAHLSLIHI